jgi:chromosome segregation ATPase
MKNFLNRCISLLVVFLAFARPVSSLPQEPDLNGNSSTGILQSELSRLIEISTRLGELNEMLRSELENSRKNSAELSVMLETSKAEATSLRYRLEALHQESTELLSRAELSSMESEELRAALKKAESSLMSLELSFNAYRLSAEAKMAALEKQNRRFKYTIAGAVVLALSGWLAFGLNR